MLRPPAYPYPLKDITLYNNCRITYMDVGVGDHTLLFIHGLANYGASWKKNMAALSKKYRCIAIDLPGNGLSENLPAYSIKAFADCIIDFIGRLALEKVCLIGHSMGGQIALRVAINAPFAVSKLALCAPAGFEQFTELDRMFYQGSMQAMSWLSNDAYNLEQTLQNSFYRFPAGADQMIKDLVSLMQRQPINKYREMIDQCVQTMLREPVFNDLHQIAQPALILFGDRDALIPNKMLHPVSTKEIGNAGVKKMQHATLQIIHECGHFLQWEQADLVNDAISQWLEQEI